MTDPKDPKVPEEHRVHRVSTRAGFDVLTLQTGHWMSQDKRHHHKFLNDTIEHVDANPKDLHPVLQEFKEAVETDTRLYMLFELMLQQVS
jgi:phosphatidylserine decarboxylase